MEDLMVIPDFLSEKEHDLMLDTCLQKLRRIAGRKYHSGHFDNVIRDYKEATISSWGHGLGKYLSGSETGSQEDLIRCKTVLPDPTLDPGVVNVLQRAYRQFDGNVEFLPIHLLELADQTGEILPHIDNVEQSGSFVAGICLGSDAVVRFSSVGNWIGEVGHVDVLLKKGCFYAQRGKLRYQFTHSIPLDPVIRTWNGQLVPALRRMTVLFRDALDLGQLPQDWQPVDAQGRRF